jgi:two-component system chemotaxis response regulator CheB
MAESRIIVIGASAGGLETVQRLAHELPANLPAPVFLVLHITPYSRSYLPEILSRAGPLPARQPKDHDPIEPGVIYVAPPDHHLLVGAGFVRVLQGAKEHNVRPAIDPLLRTAAVAYGPRVVAVLLSGMLDDGTAGLQAVKRCGGVTVVQDPHDALYPQMPQSALDHVAVDHRLPLASIGTLLARLAATPVNVPAGAYPVSDELKWEAKMAAWDLEALEGEDRPGKPSPLTCPSCKGNLWELDDNGYTRYRCRTGHAWSPLSLLAGQSDSLDTVLNEAFRALKEKLHLVQRMAHQARKRGNQPGAEHYEREAASIDRYAQALWQVLTEISRAAPDEPTGPEKAVS